MLITWTFLPHNTDSGGRGVAPIHLLKKIAAFAKIFVPDCLKLQKKNEQEFPYAVAF